MSAQNQAGRSTGEIADLVVALDSHPDISDLQQQFKEGFPNGALANSTLVKVTIEDRRMVRRRRRFVGAYLTVLSALLLTVTPWVWSTAHQAATVPTGAAVPARLLGVAISTTAPAALVLVVILMAALGSMVVLTLTFGNRAGHETLERGYLWWYITRPFSAAGLGLLFYFVIAAGLMGPVATQDQSALVVAAVAGGLAGLFTDQVLSKMRKILGLLPMSRNASGTSGTDGAEVSSPGPGEVPPAVERA